MVGDFNNIMRSFDLSQHVFGFSHIRGHRGHGLKL